MAKIHKQGELLTISDEEGLSKGLINDDIRPTKFTERTWNRWHIASLWVGMSVCIPTYMLASNMIVGGLSWKEAMMMILLGNLIVSVPMVLNGHAGTRYGIPFPVFGRAAFGTLGIHIPSILRALVACGWFGIQTWIGGLAIAAIFGAIAGDSSLAGSWNVQFVGFLLFWLLQMFFVWKGTESIKWLETLAAPLLILIGVVMLTVGISGGGGLSNVLDSSYEFSKPTVTFAPSEAGAVATFNVVKDENEKPRAASYRYVLSTAATADNVTTQLNQAKYQPLPTDLMLKINRDNLTDVSAISVQFKNAKSESSAFTAQFAPLAPKGETPWMTYLFWLTAMVAFWATLALNISDITRYAASQKDQVIGQFVGLPTTMTLYAFIGVAVTCAAIVMFDDILIAQDAPWDPITLIARFDDQPLMLIICQLSILVATLSTNIAANVISPANSFANLRPQSISFKMGGYITGVIGIIILPWKLMGVIVGFLLTYGAILGPVVGVLIADYFLVRKQSLNLLDLYRDNGEYSYQGGFNLIALLCLVLGIAPVLAGLYVTDLKPLYDMGWFAGFLVSFVSYAILFKKPTSSTPSESTPVAE
jgi:cytosine/uracil/thiamine/allantoin permease